MNTMRKLFALSMVALLALTLAIAAVGCGKKEDEAATPAPETSTMASDSTANMGGMTDSTHSMMADTTAKK